MEFLPIDTSSDDDDYASLQHPFKINIIKIYSNDDYFDEDKDSNVEILLVCPLSLFTRKTNGSINSLPGLAWSFPEITT